MRNYLTCSLKVLLKFSYLANKNYFIINALQGNGIYSANKTFQSCKNWKELKTTPLSQAGWLNKSSINMEKIVKMFEGKLPYLRRQGSRKEFNLKSTIL